MQAELDRRFPERVKLRAVDVEDLRDGGRCSKVFGLAPPSEPADSPMNFNWSKWAESGALSRRSDTSATAYAADDLALRSRKAGNSKIPVVTPAWLEHLQSMDPRRVVFAHDQAVWEPLHN